MITQTVHLKAYSFMGFCSLIKVVEKLKDYFLTPETAINNFKGLIE